MLCDTRIFSRSSQRVPAGRDNRKTIETFSAGLAAGQPYRVSGAMTGRGDQVPPLIYDFALPGGAVNWWVMVAVPTVSLNTCLDSTPTRRVA
jgi:hypothetical protein